MKTCPQCANRIEDGATVCPHCQSDLSPASAAPSPHRGRTVALLGAAAIVLVAGSATTWWAIGRSHETSVATSAATSAVAPSARADQSAMPAALQSRLMGVEGAPVPGFTVQQFHDCFHDDPNSGIDWRQTDARTFIAETAWHDPMTDKVESKKLMVVIPPPEADGPLPTGPATFDQLTRRIAVVKRITINDEDVTPFELYGELMALHCHIKRETFAPETATPPAATPAPTSSSPVNVGNDPAPVTTLTAAQRKELDAVYFNCDHEGVLGCLQADCDKPSAAAGSSADAGSRAEIQYLYAATHNEQPDALTPKLRACFVAAGGHF